MVHCYISGTVVQQKFKFGYFSMYLLLKIHTKEYKKKIPLFRMSFIIQFNIYLVTETK